MTALTELAASTGRLSAIAETLPPGGIELAYHAALPVVVDSGLLHLIRLNFLVDPPVIVPYETEAKLLLSPLFREVAGGLFEIEPDLRNLLLLGLNTAFGRNRPQSVAQLLHRYTMETDAWRAHPSLQVAQRITALALLDPARGEAWLAENARGADPAAPLSQNWFVAMRHRRAAYPSTEATFDEIIERAVGSPDREISTGILRHLAQLPGAGNAAAALRRLTTDDESSLRRVQLSPDAARVVLGHRLGQARRARGFSGRMLAAELGWSQAKLSRIENGKVNITRTDLQAVLQVLRFDADAAAEVEALAERSHPAAAAVRTDSAPNRVDVLIVTALSVEFAAARAAGSVALPGARGVPEWREHGTDSPTPYLMGEYLLDDGRRLAIALARPARLGGRQVAPTASSLAIQLRPATLAMCGVCGGNPAETTLGDIVVASLIIQGVGPTAAESVLLGDNGQFMLDQNRLRAAQDFDPAGLPSYGAANELDAMLWLFERLRDRQDPRSNPARERYFPRGTWKPRLQQWETEGLITHDADGALTLTERGSATLQEHLYNHVDSPEHLPFAVHVAPMVSGLVGDPPWDRFREAGVRRVAAMDMEAETIAAAATDTGLSWLVVKGVADHASAKDDRYVEFAARASAEVLYSLLAELLRNAGVTRP